MAIHDPSEFGIVYGSQNKVLAFHTDMDKPVLLTERIDKEERGGGHVTSLAFDKSKKELYDAAGYEGVVRNTLTGEKVYSFNPEKNCAIHSLCFYNGNLVALQQIGNYVASLVDTQSGSNIAIITADREKGLKFRPSSLSMAITNRGRIYVSSENIIEVIPQEKGQTKVKRLTDYLSDFTRLITNGKDVYCVYNYHDPEGAQVRRVPSHKKVAFWKPSIDNKDPSNNKVYGFPDISAIIGDTLVVGTTIYKSTTTMYKHPDHSLYLIQLTQKMLEARKGARATPQLLLKEAFEDAHVYGVGNPMIIIPRKDLENIISIVVNR